MIFDEYKKLNNFGNKTRNKTQLEPKSEEGSDRNMIYKKYKSSKIFEPTNPNNNEIRKPSENTLAHRKSLKNIVSGKITTNSSLKSKKELTHNEIGENKANLNKGSNESKQRDTNFDSTANSNRKYINENSKNLNHDFKHYKNNSNKFLNKIKKTSKEKYIANKINPSDQSNLGCSINNLLSVSMNNNNSDKDKNYNLNSMRTAHLKVDNIFHSHEQGVHKAQDSSHFKKSMNFGTENSSNINCKNSTNPREFSLRSNFSNIFNDQDKSNQINKLRSTTSDLYASHNKNNISFMIQNPDYNIINNLPAELPKSPTHNRTLTDLDYSSRAAKNKSDYLNTDGVIKEEEEKIGDKKRLNTEGNLSSKKNFNRKSMLKNDENQNTLNLPQPSGIKGDGSEKHSRLQKSISNNIINSDWEKNKKNSIKEVYEKKFHKIDTPKKIQLMNQASVLFDDAFYQNTCQDYKMEDINMTIVPKKETHPDDPGKGSNASSYVMDPGFFKREMAKKGIHVYNIKQVDNNDNSGAKTTGLKFTLKKNTSSEANDKLINSVQEEIANKGFAISNLQDKPAYKKSTDIFPHGLKWDQTENTRDLEPRLKKFNTEKNIVSHNTLKKEDKLRNQIYVDNPLYKNKYTNLIRTPNEKKNKAPTPNAKVNLVKKVPKAK